MIERFVSARHDLISEITSAGPSEEVRSFGSDKSIAFWQNRMAHETAIHRWDADSAVDVNPDPIPPEVAMSGLAEGLHIHVERPLKDVEVGGNGERVLLQCTDVGGTWIIQMLQRGVQVEAAPKRKESFEATITGSASQLWLMVTGRIPFENVGFEGDGTTLDRLRGALQLIPPVAL